MANYSVPQAAIAMGDGRYYTTFINPNGTQTRWFSNQDTHITDPNFVAPPDSVWSDVRASSVAVLAQRQTLLDTAKRLAETAGPVVPFDQYLAIKAQQVAQRTAATKTINTTNTGATTDVNGNPSSDPVFGLFGDDSPVVFGIMHEYTAIGIVAVLGLVLIMNAKKGR